MFLLSSALVKNHRYVPFFKSFIHLKCSFYSQYKKLTEAAGIFSNNQDYRIRK